MALSRATFAKAKKILQSGHVAQVDDKTFQVRSTSDPDKIYVVTSGHCDCIGFRFNHDCAHYEAVRLFKKENKI